VSGIGAVALDSTAIRGYVAGRPYLAAVVWHAVKHGVVLMVPAATPPGPPAAAVACHHRRSRAAA